MGKEKLILIIGIIVSVFSFITNFANGNFSFLELIILLISIYTILMVSHYTKIGITFVIMGLISIVVNSTSGFSFHGLIYIIGGLMLISNEE